MPLLLKMVTISFNPSEIQPTDNPNYKFQINDTVEILGSDWTGVVISRHNGADNSWILHRQFIMFCHAPWYQVRCKDGLFQVPQMLLKPT